MANTEYEVRSNLAKNRLIIVGKGHASDEMLTVAVNKILEEAKKLRPGFDVVIDISELTAASPKGAEMIKNTQIFLKQSGVRHVVRVTRGALFAKMQFDRTGKEAGYTEGTVLSDSASSIEEAEKMLDAHPNPSEQK